MRYTKDLKEITKNQKPDSQNNKISKPNKTVHIITTRQIKKITVKTDEKQVARSTLSSEHKMYIWMLNVWQNDKNNYVKWD